MLKWVLQKIVGSKNQREIKRMRPIIAKINQLEEQYQNDSEEQIRDRVEEWQKYLHRFLPLEVPTKRQLELMEPTVVSEIANGLKNRLESLRPDFPNLPEVTDSLESIEEAKAAFAEIEESFPKLRDTYLDKILPEAYATVKNGARRLCGSQSPSAMTNFLGRWSTSTSSSSAESPSTRA